MSGENDRKLVGFKWTLKSSAVAVSLAEGRTKAETAKTHNVGEATIYRWQQHQEFAAEVDRLSLMVDIAGRAERLRLAMRAIRQKTREDGTVLTEKDILDWLKFAQSETDGIKLDIAAVADAASSVADR